MGLHNGRVSSRETGDSVLEHSNPPPHPFWPSKIFHSLVMVMPNMMEPPFAHELGILSLLMSLSGRISVSQRILPSDVCSSPPTAHSAKTFVYVGVEGKGRLWKDGVTEPFEQGQFFATQGGTGTLYCILNEGNDDFIYLEIEHVSLCAPKFLDSFNFHPRPASRTGYSGFQRTKLRKRKQSTRAKPGGKNH